MHSNQSEEIKSDELDQIRKLIQQHKWEELKQLDLTRIDPNINLDNGSFNKGISLALAVVFHDQWDLFNKLDLTKINPNAKPEHESHPSKGISFALTLAFSGRWDLLNKLDLSKVDLNAQPEHDSHPDKGMTLALILASKKQWSLLNKLDLSEADPNAKSKQGSSLALVLAVDKKWDLLKKLDLTKIDLNAKAEDKIDLKNSKSLALLLALDNQWDLLKTLIELQRIDINALYSNDKELFQFLIENDQKDILRIIYLNKKSLAKKIIINDESNALFENMLLLLIDDHNTELKLKNFLSQFYDKNEITTLIARFQSSQAISDYLNYYLAKQCAELVQDKNSIDENIKNINDVLTHINLIKDKMFYASAKECESNMFNSILKNEKLCTILVQKNTHYFPDQIGLSQASLWAPVERVRFARDIACSQSANKTFMQNYLGEAYEKLQKIRIEEESKKKPNVNSFFNHNPKPSSGEGEVVLDDSATNSCM